MTKQSFQPIKVVDLEMSRPLTPIASLAGYGSIEGLVRLYGRPLGKVIIPVTEDQCSPATQLEAILQQQNGSTLTHLLLDRLSQFSHSSSLKLSDLWVEDQPLDHFPLVTVAVCTRDRVEDLKLCLDALQRLEYPRLDLLVIDNAPSNDDTQHFITTHYPQVRYVRELRPGLSWARNRAILEAKGEIIAYTDDDVMVDPNWVNAIARVFVHHTEVMAVTGYVAAYELETKAQIVFEQAYRFGRGFQVKWAKGDRANQSKMIADYGGSAKFGTGANMAFRRTVFEAIGSFDPALGAGTITTGGEDLEMFFRVLMEGYTLVYEPAALVRHRHRRDYAQLEKQVANNGIGVAAYLIRNATAYPGHTLEFLILGWRLLIWWNVRRLLASFIRPAPHRPRDLILIELRGAFRGLNRYAQACQIARQLEQKFEALESIDSNQTYVAQASH